jgi:choline dehydrogenase-like flavoprotein
VTSNRLAGSKKRYDAIIVGSGLSGGWAAKELAEGGLDVIVLEAGPFLAGPEVLAPDVCDADQRGKILKRQPIQCTHASYPQQNPNLFVDDLDNPYEQGAETPFVWIRGRQVGGRSLTWGGVALRFSDYEFLAPRKDGFGACWPIRYADIAEHYSKVETFLGVQGSQEELTQLPDGVFLAPSQLTETERAFKQSVEGRWPERKVIAGRGIASDPNAAGGWPAKTSVGTTLRSAVATGRAEIQANTIVSHLVTNSRTGEVEGVACVERQTGKLFEVFGRVVILAASAIESVRILLNSRSSKFPEGIGGSSGILGRFLLDHVVVWITGSIPGAQESSEYPLGGADSILMPRFRNLEEADCNFIRGYGLWGAMQRGAAARYWALHALLEVLPRPQNRVTLSESVRDAWGIPVPRITMTYCENERRMKLDALTCVEEMSKEAGLPVYQRGQTLPGQYVHEAGGARMGSDPSTSVLNAFNQCWDAPNVFVVDGACFVTSGWQNPSLTIMALAVRACEYVLEQFKSGVF